jgi:hypothetical protein
VKVKVGDIVRVFQVDPDNWIEAENEIGIVVGLAKRLYVPAAKVMVAGKVAEFDLSELQVLNDETNAW